MQALISTALGFGLLLYLLRVQARRLARIEQALTLHLHTWLMQRFGLPFDEGGFGGAQAPSAPLVGTLKSHRVLRLGSRLITPDQEAHMGYQLRAQVILHDEQRRFWLVIWHAHWDKGRATLAQAPAVLPITELRARRALFNHPADYRRAFGEAPTRAALQAWRKVHPGQEPPEPPDDWPR